MAPPLLLPKQCKQCGDQPHFIHCVAQVTQHALTALYNEKRHAGRPRADHTTQFILKVGRDMRHVASGFDLPICGVFYDSLTGTFRVMKEVRCNSEASASLHVCTDGPHTCMLI